MTKLSLVTLIASLAIAAGGVTAVAITGLSPVLKNQEETRQIDSLIAALENGEAAESEESEEGRASSINASSSTKEEAIDDPGTKKDNIFEMEALPFTGESQNASKTFGHICPVNSLFFNTAFSGNLCIRNVTSKEVTNTFTLSFSSSEAYNVDLIVRVASRYQNNTWPEDYLSSAITMTMNGENVNLSNILVPGSTAEAKIGGNNYANMNSVTVPLTLAKGDNKMVITPTASFLNIDYLNVRTSATLSGFTPKWFGDPEKVITIVKAPTTSVTGQIRFSDQNCSDTATYDLPTLSSSNGYRESNGKFSLQILGKNFEFDA